MAEDKKASITLLNRGQRSFDFGFVNNTDGTPDTKQPLRHAPNTSYAYSVDEATKMMKRYPKELVDITKLPGSVDNRKLKIERDQLAKDNEALKARLAELESATGTFAPEEAQVKAPTELVDEKKKKK